MLKTKSAGLWNGSETTERGRADKEAWGVSGENDWQGVCCSALVRPATSSELLS